MNGILTLVRTKLNDPFTGNRACRFRVTRSYTYMRTEKTKVSSRPGVRWLPWQLLRSCTQRGWLRNAIQNNLLRTKVTPHQKWTKVGRNLKGVLDRWFDKCLWYQQETWWFWLLFWSGVLCWNVDALFIFSFFFWPSCQYAFALQE